MVVCICYTILGRIILVGLLEEPTLSSRQEDWDVCFTKEEEANKGRKNADDGQCPVDSTPAEASYDNAAEKRADSGKTVSKERDKRNV